MVPSTKVLSKSHSLKIWVDDSLLLDHEGLPHVLVLAFQLVIFGCMGQGLLSFLNLGTIDKLLLEHVGLPHVLNLAVHLVILFGLVGRGDHP